MKPENRDAGYFWDMLEAARETRELMQGVTLEALLADFKIRRALERTLEIIGEAASRVSESSRTMHQEIPWAAVIGQRNVIAHRYAALDYGLLFATATREVPALVARLEQIVERFAKDAK
jgi:uncharacterized protein with HEPN domain